MPVNFMKKSIFLATKIGTQGFFSRLLLKSTALLLIFLFAFPSSFLLAGEKKGGKEDIREEVSVPDKKVEVVDKPHNELILENRNTDSTERTSKTEGREKRKEFEMEELGSPSNDQNLLAQMTAGAKSTDNQIGKINVDEMTGALLYEFPINVPPGRNGLQPDLKLSYNNQARENHGMVGLGWSINIPYIQRINKSGSEKMYTEHDYISSLSGELVLFSTSSNVAVFKPLVENGNFLLYTLSNNKWTVTDKQGTVYSFGHTSATRVFDPDNSSKVFKWSLEEIRDANQNYVRYEYNKHDGQIYPSRIVYTGHENTDGIFEVHFSTTTRQDNVKMFNSGFLLPNDYLISEIKMEINNEWVKKYDLEYATSTHGFTSLLSSVTESGRDDLNNVIELPPTVFTYQSVSAEWDQEPDMDFPSPAAFIFYESSDVDDIKNNGTQMVDVNDDGLLDIIHSKGATSSAYVRTEDGWATSTFTLPVAIVNEEGEDQGVRFADVDGDGRIDAFRYREGLSDALYRNTGAGWAPVSLPQHLLPDYKFASSQGGDTGVRFFDINGDGRADFVYSKEGGGSEVYLYNGFIWDHHPEWEVPVGFIIGSHERDNGVRPADVNNDGLVDLLYCSSTNGGFYSKVQFNQGDGTWVQGGSPEVYSVTACFSDDDWEDTGTRLIDLDDDGLLDFSRKKENGTEESFININSDNPSVTSLQIPRPVVQSSYGADNGTRLEDLNGDGLTDQISHYLGTEDPKFAIRKGKRGEILSAIKDTRGSTTTIDYKMSALYRDSNGDLLNPSLPINTNTVEKVSVYDGFATTSEYLYRYASGTFYFENFRSKKFAGFGRVERTDALGNVVKTYFHQGNYTATSTGEYDDHISKAGRPYRIEQYDSNGNLFSKTINRWDRYDTITTAVATSSFVKFVDTLEFTYDGDSDHREKAESYSYNNDNGNLSQKISWGEVTGSDDGTFSDTGGDKLATDLTYATSSATSSITFLSREKVTDQSSAVVRDSKIYYDNLSFGSLTKGNATKQEVLKSGSSYIDTEKTYNSYGLVTQEKDPRDKVTTYSYDSFNLYPATTTNPVSHAQEYLYDYSLGKPKQITDANDFVFQVVYDGLDRVLEEKQPETATSSRLVTKVTYEYTDDAFPTSVTRTEHLSPKLSVSSYVYLDGLGRVIQERRKAEDNNKYGVKDTKYGLTGQKSKESLLYFATGSAYTTATSTNALWNNFTYDAVGRIKDISNAVGTTTNTYDDWKLTVTDANGNDKDLYKDARGNLVQVDEHDGTSTYSTYYEWSPLGNLTKITDALGNVRNFIYDNLGRRLKAEDLHAPSDSTYASSTFAYDDSGNMTSMVNGAGQTVNYTYNDINQPLTEDFTGIAGTEKTYTYDSCEGGVGRLCSVIVSGSTTVTTSFAYNPLGGVKMKAQDFGGNDYYQKDILSDRLGNPVSVSYPDGTVVDYEYNDGGLVEKVLLTNAGTSTAEEVLSDLDYSPEGKVAYQLYGNDVFTQNNYDASKLYRLASVYTETPLGGIDPAMQNLHYTYDAVGNITKLEDISETNNSKTILYTYDDLSRLATASSTYVGGGPGYKESYVYNPIGNILSKGNSITAYYYQGTTTGSYANPHAVTKIRTSPISYDLNGNLINYLSATSTYDYNNQLVSYKKSGVTTSYAYDYLGDRVVYSSGNTTTRYLDRDYSVASSTDITQSLHIFLGDRMVATVDKTSTSSPEIHYHHTDHLSGSNLSTDKDALVSEITDYYPYGAIRYNPTYDGFRESRKFTGHELDTETGMTYMGARYYAGDMGRFRSVDPVYLAVGTDGIKQKTGLELPLYLSDPQGMNSYAYARNNPVRNVDPTGEWWETALDIVSLALSTYDYNRNPGIMTGFWLALDIGGTAAPIPSPGLVKNGARTIKIAGYFHDVSRRTGLGVDGVVNLGGLFAKNINFNFSGRAWSSGEAGNDVANLVGHFGLHGSEFGAKNVDEYYQSANKFIDSKQGVALPTSGDRIEIWDTNTNTLAVTNKRGDTIKTFYKVTDPSKINSYNNKLDNIKKN